jgi:mono/diheme cytochrome c family protein
MRPVAILFALVLMACGGSARRSETSVGKPPPITKPGEKRGEVGFMKFCNQCHPMGEGGLGPTINDKPLPGAAIKLKVRTGLGGDMPTFSSEEIPEQALDEIVEYIEALRSNR